MVELELYLNLIEVFLLVGALLLALLFSTAALKSAWRAETLANQAYRMQRAAKREWDLHQEAQDLTTERCTFCNGRGRQVN